MNEWIDGQMYVCMYEWMDGCIDVFVYVGRQLWMDEWMDGWMDGCTWSKRNMHVCGVTDKTRQDKTRDSVLGPKATCMCAASQTERSEGEEATLVVAVVVE